MPRSAGLWGERMFVFLSKFLPLFVYPLGLACILLVLYLWVNRRQPGKKTLIYLVLLLFFIGGNRWTAATLQRSLEWRYLPPETLPRNAVVVVLGGGTESAQYPRQMAEVNSAGDRVLYAARLYHQGVAANILLSGGNISWLGARTSSPAEDMQEIITLAGVPEDILWLQGKSQNTYEDALYSAEILREQGVEEIVLVTSASHMPRSVALFEKQGFRVIPAPADYSITEEIWQVLWHPTLSDFLVGIVPNAGNLADINSVMKEYIGMLIYSLRGWM